MRRPLRRRAERGASAVEFALVMPILLLLVFGIIQYGWYFYAMQAGTSAVGDAVRRVTVGDCTSSASGLTTVNSSDLKSFLKNRLGAATTQDASTLAPAVAYTNPDGTTATSLQVGGNVQVTLRFQTLDLNFPFIPVPDDGHVSRVVTGRVEDTTATVGGCS